MLVYRIQRTRYNSELSGEGAKKFGGRWNPQGTPMLYASCSVSLAIIELLVNIGSYANLGNGQFNVLTIHIPDSSPVDNWEIPQMPEGWDSLPHPYATQIMGDDWVKENRALAVLVPSSVISLEKNVLINCLHKDFEFVKVVSINPFDNGKRFTKS